MYGYDPYQLMEPPALAEVEEDLFEEPRDYHEFFWDEAIERGSNYVSGFSQRLHTQVCRFDKKGEHVIMARNCPHFEVEDEEGKRIRKGWTCQ